MTGTKSLQTSRFLLRRHVPEDADLLYQKVYINRQWQGGADPVTRDGAEEIAHFYLTGQDYVDLPVSTDMTVQKNGIRGFDVLRRQMRSAYELLRTDAPDRLFTLGGGCDADVPAIVYLSEKYRGNLTLVWLDAHGDLNAPEESQSALFYGMPLRAVMDDHCFGLLENLCPLKPSQIIHIGGRDFDDAERTFISENSMAAHTVQEVRSDREFLRRIARETQSGPVYIHLDLDVLDPSDFPNTPLPVGDGLRCGEVWDILNAFADQLVGLGVYEYAPAESKAAFMEKLIQFGLAL